MRKLFSFLVLSVWVCTGLRAQTTPSGSDYLVARDIPAHTLFYEYAGTGTLMPKIKWGLDEAWCSEANMLQGRNYLNLFNKNVDIVRLSFQPCYALSNSNGLTDDHMTDLTERLRVLSLLWNGKTANKPEIFLNCDPKDNMNSYYQGTTSAYVTKWVNLIKATGQYVENQGYTVTGISPFNEPDLRSTKYPPTSTAISDASYRTNSAKMQSDICAALKNDSWGSSKKRLAGNTLNPDYALNYYSSYKANIDEGNTHQLAGTPQNFVAFLNQVSNVDGKPLCQDEMHNVMEAMVGAEYGMDDAVWWGTSEHARTQFCRANDGTGYRLAYLWDEGTFTASSVYRNTQDGVTEAYLGCSERQATETSYGYVSTDRDVYYDGYGPTRAFYMHLPADPNGSYQSTKQKNAERVINIQSGADVQPFPTEGSFQIMNASTGKVIQGNTAWTGWSANAAKMADGSAADGQIWSIQAVSDTIGYDFSYYTIASSNGQWWTYYLDDNNWGFEEANPMIQYPGGGSGCEQFYFVYAGDGSFYIHNRYSNLCLDLGDTCVVQRTRTNSATQKWKLVNADCTSPDLVAPATPTGLSATAQQASVKLTWNANSETDLWGYTILRTVKNANDWNTIARNVEGTTYIDNTVVQGTQYTYKIKAMDLSCNYSTASSTVDGTSTAAQGLVARWEFDGTTRDMTANCMNVALRTGNYTDSNKSGSRALSLNGSSNYAQLPYQIANMDAMTFCAWVYWNGGDSWQRIFDFGAGEDEYIFLTPSNGSNMRVVVKTNGGSEQVLSTTKLSTGTWKHVAVTMAAGSVKVYVDGSQVANSTSITAKPSDVKTICNYLGRSQFAADPLFNGNLDDVRIYNYVLSASEIATIAGSAQIEEGITEWTAGNSYYLYNIESGMFLNQGNAWGTQASLSNTGLLWDLNNGSRSGLYRLNRSGESNYLFIAGNADLYVDGSANNDFAMTQDMETGLTTISANPNGSYGTSAFGTTYVGWSGDEDVTFLLPLLKPTDHSKPGLNWRLMTATEYNNYSSTISSALSARQNMWPLLQNALAVNFDCSDAYTVYTNPASTAAQINSAYNALLTAFTAYVTANASDSTPIEISYLIDHAGCGSDTFVGWIQTSTWASNTSYYRNGDAVLQGRFTESWVPGGTSLEDRTLAQVLPSLPAGKYQASVDIVATQQDDGSLTITGINLMLDDEFVSCSTANGVPQCFTTPTLTVGEGDTPTIRLKVSNTNANWVAFDNFRLFYLGSKTPGDITQDGNVGITDVIALTNIILGRSTSGYDLDAADVNGDTHINIEDITALVNLILAQ
ncbi:MAG: hypothetical protein J6Y39_03030 [Bacteroidaceae bacterium]|nr:hypothetical protein [Bacteroidaceae bacterium]